MRLGLLGSLKWSLGLVVVRRHLRRLRRNVLRRIGELVGVLLCGRRRVLVGVCLGISDGRRDGWNASYTPLAASSWRRWCWIAAMVGV
jgi:hypothetical protein